MASFLTRAAMADRLYQQQQQERADREFELLKRRDEQARIAQREYLRPFETKELQAQFEDSMTARKDRDEQKALTNWITPYQPSVGMNDDGTRQLDVKVPVNAAIAGLMAAGLGNSGAPLDGFMQPFREQLSNASLKYNTPEEIKKKADLQDAHNKNLELIQARKKDEEAAHKRDLELIRARAERPASPGRSSSSGSSNQQSQVPAYKADKRFNGMYDKIFNQYVSDYMKSNKKTRLTADEFARLGQEAELATAGALNYQIDKPTPQPPRSPGEPTNTPAPGEIDDPFARHDQLKSGLVIPQAHAADSTMPTSARTSFNDALTDLGEPTQLRQTPQGLARPEPEPVAMAQDIITPFAPSSAVAKRLAAHTAKGLARRLPGELEAQQRKERASSSIAQAKDAAWVENVNKLAAAAERQLGRSLNNDERAYLIDAAQTGELGGMADGAIDWDHGTYLGFDGKRAPIADVFNSYDYRLRNWWSNNALNRGFRKLEDYLESKTRK